MFFLTRAAYSNAVCLSGIPTSKVGKTKAKTKTEALPGVSFLAVDVKSAAIRVLRKHSVGRQEAGHGGRNHHAPSRVPAGHETGRRRQGDASPGRELGGCRWCSTRCGSCRRRRSAHRRVLEGLGVTALGGELLAEAFGARGERGRPADTHGATPAVAGAPGGALSPHNL